MTTTEMFNVISNTRLVDIYISFTFKVISGLKQKRAESLTDS